MTKKKIDKKATPPTPVKLGIKFTNGNYFKDHILDSRIRTLVAQIGVDGWMNANRNDPADKFFNNPIFSFEMMSNEYLMMDNPVHMLVYMSLSNAGIMFTESVLEKGTGVVIKIPISKFKFIGSTKPKAVVHENLTLAEFFAFHGEVLLKGITCEECNEMIINPGTKNVAHILPKSKFPSVLGVLLNHLYLCWQCHSDFDSSWAKANVM